VPTLLLLALAAAAADGPAVDLSPPTVRPGDAFLVTVRGLPEGAEPAAEVAGRRLHFFAVPGGQRAVAGLPLEIRPGQLPVEVTWAGGGPVSASLQVAAATFPHKRLRVSDKFIRPPPPAVRRRMEADQAAFARGFAQPPGPPLFSGAFGWPREDEVTGHFGDRRTLNGTKHSTHYGTDLGGELGAKVATTNAGQVVLVRDCFASGLSVMVFHGAGLFSTYFHLSRALVKEGERVERGQEIGRVGKSGRVTGPHLHWGVKLQDLYVDPESVLRLPFE
jgi:hypothetical protein